jgi:hypothetical protein
MSTLAQRRMTVDEFLAWAEGQEGRWELYSGVARKADPDHGAQVGRKFRLGGGSAGHRVHAEAAHLLIAHARLQTRHVLRL